MSKEPVRLQKLLASYGYGSRRALEVKIANGDYMINDKVAQLGDKATEFDQIKFQGRVLSISKDRYNERTVAQKPRFIMYHKPAGQICSRVKEKDKDFETIYRKLPKLHGQRWVSIGRLDVNSSGLLLLTTDGDFAHKMQHPSANLSRKYLVRVHGTVNKAAIEKMKNGVDIGDGETGSFTEAVVTSVCTTNYWLEVSLNTGKYREVRRICSAVGLEVNRLIRISYGEYKLPKELRTGQIKELRMPDEITADKAK